MSDPKPDILLRRGTLHKALLDATARASGLGVIFPVPTHYEFVEDQGVRFFVRILTSLSEKDRELRRQAAAPAGRTNPFLPYDKDLFVADISDTHVAILNKFNVVEHHLLVITRSFEDQESLLTISDFEALDLCQSEYNSLGFYNGGEAAGASQRHKHLQVVPLPLAPEGPEIPIEPLLQNARLTDGVGAVPGLPFLHVFAIITGDRSSGSKAAKMHERYAQMLRLAGMQVPSADGGIQDRPYCLLVTSDWMLLVPRSTEFYAGISINSLGFAGALLVRDERQMETLRRVGPMTALKAVGLPESSM